MQYTQEQLNSKYNSLPKNIKDLMDSVEIGVQVVEIGERNGLTLDQQADLADQVSLVLLGMLPMNKFLDSLVYNLSINRKTAEEISAEVNNEIFKEIRISLQKPREPSDTIPSEPTSKTLTQPTNTPTPQPKTPPPPPSIPKIQFQPLPSIQTPYKNPITATPQPQPQQASAPIKPTFEQAGRFTVDKPPVGMPQYKESDIKKDNVLKGIEDPEISMVDHLLSKPVNTVSGIEVKKPIEKPAEEKRPYASDPYREQI